MTNPLELAPETLVETVTGLLQRAQTAEAVQLAEGLDRGIEAPLLLNLRAYWLEGQNRVADAHADLQRAHQLAPSDPIVLNALGLCLAKLGRAEEALTAFHRCVELAPDFGPAHYNCGWTLEELGDLDRAQEAFAQAARLNPQSADPPGRLATLAARRGRWEIAKKYAQQTLALAPGNAAATIALASADLAENDFRSARGRLAALINEPTLGGQDRATAISVLGDALDAEGRYHEAFAAYAAGNAIFKAAFADRMAARGEIPMRDYVAWLLKSFENPSMPHWPREERPNGDRDESPSRHLFVLGFPRSGTTLLEEVLACHPDAVTTGERDALSEIVRGLFAGQEQLADLRFLGAAGVKRFRRRYWETLEAFGIDVRNKILVDKQPFNSVRLPLIAKLFPEAKIILCLRDPRDVVLSCFRRRFSPNAANVEFLTLDGAAKLYDAVMRLVAVYREKLPLPVHEIKNETLVADFDAELARSATSQALNGCRNSAASGSARAHARSRTPSAAQISRGLRTETIGHWRNYESDLATVLPLLNGWAKTFGYQET